MKVLITYALAGAGHRRSAEAIYNFLKQNRQDLELQLVDVLAFTNRFFSFFYLRGYPFLVRYASFIWAFLFFITGSKLTRHPGRLIARPLNYFFSRRFRGLLIEKKFDYIVSTHFLPSELVAGLKLKNKIGSKLITVITDFGVHPFWISAGTDLYITASEKTKDELSTMGIKKENIRASGIPACPSFNNQMLRPNLSGKIGIDASKFTVLVMTGSFGSGPLYRIAEILHNQVQILVVCANNKRLFNKLNKANFKGLKVFGFINNTEELMAVSDIIITKPGGLSIAELLNAGLLPVFISAIPGQERENIRVLSEYGLGFFFKDMSRLKYFVLSLKDNPQKLKDLKNNIGRVAKPQACQELSLVIR